MESLLADVTAARARYGATMTNDECVALLNAVAWKNRAEGWGLGKKTSGNRGRRSDGVECSVDGLVHRETLTFVDALRDAGGKSEPTWQVAPNPSNRPWVAPIDPQREEQPDVPAPPSPETVSREDFDRAIEALAKSIMALTARVVAVERRPDVPVSVLARLDRLEAAEYALERGNTSRSWGHAHDVSTKVVRVK